jgi:hypothetical protein
MSATIFSTAFNGGGSSRYADFVVVRMTSCTFITTPMELQQVSNWARGKMSSGTANRDRTTFIERFETIIGRASSSIATRGNRGLLSRMVKGMKASSILMAEWSIPHDLDASMEMKKKPPPKPVAPPAE